MDVKRQETRLLSTTEQTHLRIPPISNMWSIWLFRNKAVAGDDDHRARCSTVTHRGMAN